MQHQPVNQPIESSNVNEVIRAILDFFIQKFHKHKKNETLTSEQK